ncbi:hypothetical protein K6119_07090 [Paracrocinitomix mangrovi]|uniref:hypothetical protein n=1 Tax=Paracrocinitomix mangrovi TaxID=2862509 RepID=UPI001C8D3464|nr:hypothetical protein [Paracrocinitomix mangrovi]UKN03277.1 hypothetical protein K6119_07090 [Paracrocinitomix mangrovi]
MKNMLVLLIVGTLNFGAFSQENLKSWKFDKEFYDLTFELEIDTFFVDTLTYHEGELFLISFLDDTSYIRINFIFANALFSCCSDNNKYIELDKSVEEGITDQKGIISGTDLYWRKLKDHNIEIVYNNCTVERKLKIDDLFESLKTHLKNF